MRFRSAAAIVAVLPLAACIPERDNVHDPLLRPEAKLSLEDRTDPGTGECAAVPPEEGFAVVSVAPRGHCLALNASDSTAASDGGDLRYTFLALVPGGTLTLASDLETAVLEMTEDQRRTLPLDVPFELRVDVTDERGATDDAVVQAFLTNRPPDVSVDRPRTIPRRALAWSGATSVTIDFTSSSADPDFDTLQWCWTAPGRAPGIPGDEETCDSITSVLAGVTLSVLDSGLHAAHLRVDDGTGPTPPAASVVAVREPAPWIATDLGAVRADPFLHAVDSGYARFALLGVDGTAALESTYPCGFFPNNGLCYGMALGSLDEPETASGVSAFYFDSGSDGVISQDIGRQYAVDRSGNPAVAWMTAIDGAPVSTTYLTVLPLGLPVFTTPQVVTAGSEHALVAADAGIGWIASDDAVRVYEGGDEPLLAAGPAGFVPAALSLRPGAATEAWVIWAPPTGEFGPSVVHSYAYDGATVTSTVRGTFGNPAQFLAWVDASRAWTFVEEEGLLLLDVDSWEALVRVPMSDVDAIVADPASGTCWAAANGGGVAWIVTTTGKTRAIELIRPAVPQFVDDQGAFWSATGISGDRRIVRSLASPETGIASTVYGPPGPQSLSWLDGGIWYVTANPVAIVHAAENGEEVRRADAVRIGASDVPLGFVSAFHVSADGRYAWLVNDLDLLRLDLVAWTDPALPPPAQSVPLAENTDLLGSTPTGDAVWAMRGSDLHFVLVDVQGAVTDMGPDATGQSFNAARSIASDSLCVVTTMTTSMSVSWLPGPSAQADIELANPLPSDALLSVAPSPERCWVAVFDGAVGGPPGPVEVFSVAPDGSYVAEFTATWGYDYGADIFVAEDESVWLLVIDESGESRPVRYDRTIGGGWRETIFPPVGASDGGGFVAR